MVEVKVVKVAIDVNTKMPVIVLKEKRGENRRMLKKVKLEEAIGMPIGHDVTKVVPGEIKGAAFRRGHILKQEDIPELLSMGKEHIYIIEEEEGEVHEEEAALRIARAVAGPEMEFTKPREGKVNIKSSVFGLLKINKTLLKEINSIPEISLATIHENAVCRPGRLLPEPRLFPCIYSKPSLEKLRNCARARVRYSRLSPSKRRRWESSSPVTKYTRA